jgi:predicted aminopeptidase
MNAYFSTHDLHHLLGASATRSRALVLKFLAALKKHFIIDVVVVFPPCQNHQKRPPRGCLTAFFGLNADILKKNILKWVFISLILAGTLTTFTGCTNLSYYRQSIGGHLSILTSARSVKNWLDDPATTPLLRQQLELSQRLRNFAVTELHLPDNESYRRYADLKRSSVVWNVVAAPELSLRLKTWCFPVAGCVGYRGYFDKAAADALLEPLRAEGLEVNVYGVPAYSTLGKLPGGFFSDPLLNTFIGYPEAELAKLIFHELAHQVAYAEGDTAFNESFATTVERIGLQRWLAQNANPQAQAEVARLGQRREAFRALTLKTRSELEALYQSPLPDAEKRQTKACIMTQMQADYASLKAGPWQGYSGYDDWFKRANNASLSMLGAYADGVPQFEALYAAQGHNLVNFYAEVKRLAALPSQQRHAAMVLNSKNLEAQHPAF